jgi:hypothetical protein
MGITSLRLNAARRGAYDNTAPQVRRSPTVSREEHESALTALRNEYEAKLMDLRAELEKSRIPQAQPQQPRPQPPPQDRRR